MTLILSFNIVISGLTITLSLSLMITILYVITRKKGHKKPTKDKAAKRRQPTYKR